MTTTMTFAGLDVHARSTHAAAIDARTGELRRARLGGESEEVVAWLKRLPEPLRACYEAGPTGFALYREAQAAGIDVCVVAPSKTPRASGDRIKSDRKDAELLARLLLAGQLQAIAVPSPSLEAARHLCRAREQVRGDLMRCRHRVSKLLLLHGRLYPEPTRWTQRHRQWLSRQRFSEPAATPVSRQRTPATQPGQWGSQPPHRQTDGIRVDVAPGARPSSRTAPSTTGRCRLDP